MNQRASLGMTYWYVLLGKSRDNNILGTPKKEAQREILVIFP
jgi:hypothetical protein